MSIKIFGFQALWSPYFFVSLAVLTVLFFLLATKWRHRFKDSEPLTRKQIILFASAMLLTYIVKGSPLDVYAHILFAVHMAQMALLYLVIPPLLIKAIPAYMWKAVINIRIIRPLFRFFTQPIIALILFNGIFSVYHMPIVFDAVKVDAALHGGYTTLLLMLSLFMWWPLVNTVEDEYRLSGIKKLGYIFGAGILLTPACALIIFSDSPMYSTFYHGGSWLQAMALCVPAGTLDSLSFSGLTGPELFSSMDPLYDQRLGGIVMKIIQEIVYGIVLSQVFFEWYRREKEEGEKFNAAFYEAKRV
ncbi:cytochrome c oxidase assembly factor CtaG [Jeotgalibacillus proteolyticus]|uniref:Cytochrome c oxidase assembly factor CtaG n=1 Tax=Jeotgalibacillus proteolyticus TaxID=2082395 RepID=A0A2S5GGK9_9BACL|nr:cytochrome c oxidase assembly factor CtaG [Jeotgalibacillus proteolyticus]PPA72170.1 cytochrome c oxidase assembly factor CtaG [Jeotgalibacillus proteolyticus]